MAVKKKTNKTEFARYLNEYGADVDKASHLLPDYMSAPNKGNSFGFWLKDKHNELFNDTYSNWWLKNESLWGVIYEDMPDTYEEYK